MQTWARLGVLVLVLAAGAAVALLAPGWEPAEIRAFRIIKAEWGAEDGEIEEIPVTILP